MSAAQSTGRLAGKTALVTGAASGIGAETARRMVAEGANVIVCDRQAEAGEALCASLGSGALFTACDVTLEEDWRGAITTGEAAFGSIEILMNCAGVSIPGAIDEISLEQWKHTMSINSDAVFLGCKFGVEAMRRAGGGSRWRQLQQLSGTGCGD